LWVKRQRANTLDPFHEDVVVLSVLVMGMAGSGTIAVVIVVALGMAGTGTVVVVVALAFISESSGCASLANLDTGRGIRDPTDCDRFFCREVASAESSIVFSVGRLPVSTSALSSC
jgi:hypothetical protein